MWEENTICSQLEALGTKDPTLNTKLDFDCRVDCDTSLEPNLPGAV